MAVQVLKGKVVVIGAGAKNLGGLISRTFGADGASSLSTTTVTLRKLRRPTR
jgi:hypothetical protein